MKKKLIIVCMAILVSTGVATAAHPNPATRQKDEGIKDRALVVLQSKCNVCHQRQNPGKVFTVDNMETHAPKIYKQVFVKQRMPRGNTIKLSQDDKDTLLRWLEAAGVSDQRADAR